MIDLSMVHQPGKSIYLQKCNLHARKSTKEKQGNSICSAPGQDCCILLPHFAKSQHLLLVWTAGMYHAYRLHRWQTNRSCWPVQVMLTAFLFQIFHTHLSPNQMPSQIFRACMARSSVRFGLHTVYNAILKCWHPTHLTNLLEAIHYPSSSCDLKNCYPLLFGTFCACFCEILIGEIQVLLKLPEC